jgi:hypothetical protein
MGISSSNTLTETISLNTHNYRFYIYDSRGICCSAFSEAQEAAIVLSLLQMPLLNLNIAGAFSDHRFL